MSAGQRSGIPLRGGQGLHAFDRDHDRHNGVRSLAQPTVESTGRLSRRTTIRGVHVSRGFHTDPRRVGRGGSEPPNRRRVGPAFVRRAARGRSGREVAARGSVAGKAWFPRSRQGSRNCRCCQLGARRSGTMANWTMPSRRDSAEVHARHLGLRPEHGRVAAGELRRSPGRPPHPPEWHGRSPRPRQRQHQH